MSIESIKSLFTAGRISEEDYQAVVDLQEQRDELLASLKYVVDEVNELISESDGVYGLHLNGDVAPWADIVAGGHFERLNSMEDAYALIDKIDGGAATEPADEQRRTKAGDDEIVRLRTERDELLVMVRRIAAPIDINNLDDYCFSAEQAYIESVREKIKKYDGVVQ